MAKFKKSFQRKCCRPSIQFILEEEKQKAKSPPGLASKQKHADH